MKVHYVWWKLYVMRGSSNIFNVKLRAIQCKLKLACESFKSMWKLKFAGECSNMRAKTPIWLWKLNFVHANFKLLVQTSIQQCKLAKYVWKLTQFSVKAPTFKCSHVLLWVQTCVHAEKSVNIIFFLFF